MCRWRYLTDGPGLPGVWSHLEIVEVVIWRIICSLSADPSVYNCSHCLRFGGFSSCRRSVAKALQATEFGGP